MAKPENVEKRRKQGRSNSADTRQKQGMSQERKDRQLLWRVNSLGERQKTGEFTDKNQKEIESLA